MKNYDTQNTVWTEVNMSYMKAVFVIEKKITHKNYKRNFV